MELNAKLKQERMEKGEWDKKVIEPLSADTSPLVTAIQPNCSPSCNA